MRTPGYLLLGAAACIFLSSCVTTDQHQEVVEQRDYYKENALQSDSLSRLVAQLEADNLRTTAYARQVAQEMEQLTVTNKNLHRNYQAVLRRMNSLEAPAASTSMARGTEQELQQSLTAYQTALQEKDARIRTLEQQLAQSSQPTTRGGGPAFGAALPDQADESCRLIEQEAAGMMGQLRQLHFNVGQALAAYSSAASPIELSDPTTSFAIKVRSDWLFQQGIPRVSQEGLSAINRLVQLALPYKNLDLFIETYPEENLANAWERSAEYASVVAKELAARGIPVDQIYATGKSFRPSGADGQPLAGHTLLVFKPQYEDLHRKVQQLNGQ